MLERDYEMECNTMQYQLKVVPWHLLYHIIFHCHVSWTGLPITSFMSHLMARHLLKILTCNKSCSWEQRLGEFVEILVAQKMPSNSYTIARCISLLRQLWKSWTEISSKTMNTWEPAERNTHHCESWRKAIQLRPNHDVVSGEMLWRLQALATASKKAKLQACLALAQT